jgi:hypothetical protein
MVFLCLLDGQVGLLGWQLARLRCVHPGRWPPRSSMAAAPAPAFAPAPAPAPDSWRPALRAQIALWQCMAMGCVYLAYVAATLRLGQGQEPVRAEPELHEVPRELSSGARVGVGVVLQPAR